MSDVHKMVTTLAADCVAHRARQVARVLTRVYDDALRPLDIQASQLFLLVAAANAGDDGGPIGRIAKVLLMDQTTVSRNVVPLVKSGLLRFAASPDDARAKIVVVTAAGKRMIEAAYPRWKDAQRAVERTVGAERFDALHEELGAIVAIADEISL